MDTKTESGTTATGGIAEGKPIAENGPAELVIEPKPNPIVVEIDKWFVEHFHGSVVSQSTEVYNHVLKAVTDLKARFTKGG